MTFQERTKWLRVELALARMAGAEMAIGRRDIDENWVEGLLCAWKQVRVMRETGKVLTHEELGRRLAG